MNDIAFVFKSTAVAEDPERLFKPFLDIDFDYYYLNSEGKDKVLKKDIDLDLSLLDDYKIICPIGAEPLKYIAKLTGVIKYNGILIENRYFPIIHPGLLEWKPQYKEEIQKACTKLTALNLGEISEVQKIEKDHRYLDTMELFDHYINNSLIGATHIVTDIETTSLSPRKGDIIGVAFSTKIHEGVFVPVHLIRKRLEILQKCFNEAIVIFHNAKFDMAWLLLELDLTFPNFEDTMLLHYCLLEAVGTHALKPLALQFTDLGDYERDLDEYKKSFCRKNKILLADFNYGMLPIEILFPYACKDGDGTMQLFEKFKPIVDSSERFTFIYQKLLIRGTRALMRLESNGGPIDVDFLMALYEDYDIDIEECIEEIRLDEDVQRFERMEGKTFNPNSTAQLRKVFFTLKNLSPIKMTEGGVESVDKEVLELLDDPLAEIIRDLREKTKLRGTYMENILKGMDKDKRLRSNFNLTGTVAGRLSSSGTINYQNIPRNNKDIKKIFRARKGFKIVQADLGNAEVYCASVLSDDKFLQKAFVEKLDFHSYIAKQIFKLDCPVEDVKRLYPQARQNAKAITFGIMYQAGPGKIAEEAGVSITEAKAFIAKYFREANNLESFIRASNLFIENNAYIYSFFGRKRRLSEAKSFNRGVRSHAVRSGVNFLVQSVASDINLMGFMDAVDWIWDNGYQDSILPFTVVHDSVVAEVRDELIGPWSTNLIKFMQVDRGIMIPNTPIKVDIGVGETWGTLDNE